MKQVKKFRSRASAQEHVDAVNAKLGLPKHYSQADLDSGELVEVGKGRHVPVATLVKQHAVRMLLSPTGKSFAVPVVPGDEEVNPDSVISEVDADWEYEDERAERLAAEVPAVPKEVVKI